MLLYMGLLFCFVAFSLFGIVEIRYMGQYTKDIWQLYVHVLYKMVFNILLEYGIENMISYNSSYSRIINILSFKMLLINVIFWYYKYFNEFVQ